jgi:hypothetical protein
MDLVSTEKPFRSVASAEAAVNDESENVAPGRGYSDRARSQTSRRASIDTPGRAVLAST